MYYGKYDVEITNLENEIRRLNRSIIQCRNEVERLENTYDKMREVAHPYALRSLLDEIHKAEDCLLDFTYKKYVKVDKLERLKDEWRESSPRSDFYGLQDDVDIIIEIYKNGFIKGHII